MKKIFTLLFLASLLSKCASSSAGIATSNIPVVDQKYSIIGAVEESDYWLTLDFAIFGFPLSKPPINKVMDSAIQNSGGDALINIRHWNDKIVLLFLTINRLGIKAEAIKFINEPSKKK